MQSGPAGDEDRELAATRQQVGDDRRRRWQMLEVVQQQQARPISEVGSEALQGITTALLLESEGMANG